MTASPPMPAASPGATPSARQLTAIVGVLSLAVFMSSLDLFIVNLAFPYIGKQYPGTGLSSLSWVLTAYTIVFAAGCWCPLAGGPTGSGAAAPSSLAWPAFSLGSPLCGVALWCGRADRGQGHPGDRGRPHGARIAVAAAGVGLGAGQAAGPGDLVCPGRARSCTRAGARRRSGPDQLAMGLLDQSSPSALPPSCWP